MKFSFTHNTLTFEGDDIVTNSIPSFLSTYNFSEVSTTTTHHMFQVKIRTIKEIVTFADYMRTQKYLLDYNSAMMLFHQTNELLINLKQVGLYIPVFHIKDFVVMSDGENIWIVYVGLSEKTIFRAIDGEIIVPLNVGDAGAFFSPEIGIKRLPLKVPDPYGCSIYAVGLLVKACLCGDADSNMDEIYTTKLYWAILRSIEERIYLIV
jgi:hypothetical protein